MKVKKKEKPQYSSMQFPSLYILFPCAMKEKFSNSNRKYLKGWTLGYIRHNDKHK